jgi:hypothetical protein
MLWPRLCDTDNHQCPGLGNAEFPEIWKQSQD